MNSTPPAPPAAQPPLFDVVMGQSVATFHRDGAEHVAATVRHVIERDPCEGMSDAAVGRAADQEEAHPAAPRAEAVRAQADREQGTWLEADRRAARVAR